MGFLTALNARIDSAQPALCSPIVGRSRQCGLSTLVACGTCARCQPILPEPYKNRPFTQGKEDTAGRTFIGTLEMPGYSTTALLGCVYRTRPCDVPAVNARGHTARGGGYKYGPSSSMP